MWCSSPENDPIPYPCKAVLEAEQIAWERWHATRPFKERLNSAVKSILPENPLGRAVAVVVLAAGIIGATAVPEIEHVLNTVKSKMSCTETPLAVKSMEYFYRQENFVYAARYGRFTLAENPNICPEDRNRIIKIVLNSEMNTPGL